ncbi:O-antigen ligase family protein [Algibacter sp.]|nr:O-antigen ligase family protein [Algibacter sp.]MDB4273903.1 O-antigen ligase family protein [Algibacter sp.]
MHKSSNYSKMLVLLIVISIFTKELFSGNIGGVSIDFFAYGVSTVLFINYFMHFHSNQKIINFLIYAVITALFSILIFDLEWFPFFKAIVPIFIIYLSTYFVIRKHAQFLPKIVDTYINIAYITAIFGILQLILSFMGINILIKIPHRIDSIAYEPSHYAAIIMPAVILTVFQYKKYKRKAVILLTALIGTVSLTSYVVFILIWAFPRLTNRSAIIAIPLALVSMFYLQTFNLNFSQRFLSAEEVIMGETDISEANGTVLSFGTNLEVALFTIKKSPIWGSGIGGHESMYKKYYAGKIFEDSFYYGMNQKSAHSLTIRILSELGVLGLLIYVSFLFKTYIKRSDDLFHHLVSLACLSHFAVKSFKLGGYIDYGTPFFFCLLIVNYMVFRSKKKIFIKRKYLPK